ncbi:MAG TPA: translation initiation factor [Candidatus Woesearchaeota archaeon]|nr:translation initiation factor [Candidatus Woesearchaeota archaeon]
MADVCLKCGLPDDLCVCETIAREAQKIKVRIVKRRYGKKYTIIEGIDSKAINVKDLTKKLKSKTACGGTYKDNIIELQGDHRNKVKGFLIEFGFPPEQIEIM